MRISSALFALIVLALVSDMACAKLIDFEDLAHTDPFGFPTDSWGEIKDGYGGFAWANDPSGDPASGNPCWASMEGFIYMPGTGTTYAFGEGLSIISPGRDFSLRSVDVGSYFYKGQDVSMAGWDNGTMKYKDTMVIGSTFSLSSLTLNYDNIDRFALWAGDLGTLEPPFDAPHVLCVDNIALSETASAPVPEPSTLFILGAGILSFTSLYRRLTSPKGGR